MFRGGGAAPAGNPNSQTSTMRDGQSTPQEPKGPAKANEKAAEIPKEYADMVERTNQLASEAIAAVNQSSDNARQQTQELSWAMSRQAKQPVSVDVSVEPSKVELTIVNEKRATGYKVIRNDDGQVDHLEVVRDE